MKFALLLFTLLFYGVIFHSQVPQGIPYQAVVRDNQGTPISSQQNVVRFSLHEASADGQVIFRETQNTTTNDQGLFSLSFGSGVPSIGSFTSINWGSGYKFLQVEVDFGAGFNDMGTQQLMSVPYALYSASSGNGTNNQNSNYNPSSDSVLTLVGKMTLSPGTYIVPAGEVWELESFNLDANSFSTVEGIYLNCEPSFSSLRCRYWLPSSNILVLSLDGWEFYDGDNFGSTGYAYNGQNGVGFLSNTYYSTTDCSICPPTSTYSFSRSTDVISLNLPIYASGSQELFIQNGYRVSISKFK
jgi:hypothetical protein